MGSEQKLITFSPAEWEPRTGDDLRLMRDVTERDLSIFEQGVKHGDFHLFRVSNGGEFVGWVIWSIDHEPDGISVVINAASALPVKGKDVSALMFETFENAGRKIGARALRAWTTRPGLRRKMEARGAVTRFEMEYQL